MTDPTDPHPIPAHRLVPLPPSWAAPTPPAVPHSPLGVFLLDNDETLPEPPAYAAWRAASIALHRREIAADGLTAAQDYEATVALLATHLDDAELLAMAHGRLDVATYLRLGDVLTIGRRGFVLGSMALASSGLRWHLEELARDRGYRVGRSVTCVCTPMQVIEAKVARAIGAVGARALARAIDRDDRTEFRRLAVAADLTGPDVAMAHADPDGVVLALLLVARTLARGGAA